MTRADPKGLHRGTSSRAPSRGGALLPHPTGARARGSAYGSGIDVALLHGFAASAFTWRDLEGPLAEVHEVAVLDRPWAPLRDQVTATLDALDQLRCHEAVLVGHSAGCEVAVATAVTAPGRVRALVLLAPVLGRGAPRLAAALAAVPGSERVAPPLLRAGCRFLGPVLRSVWHDPSGVTPQVVDGYRTPLREPGVAEALWAMTRVDASRADLVAGATALDCPCLVIVGRSDRWATPVPIGGARTVWLEGCGHLPHEEQPTRTATEILGFLQEVERGEPSG